MKRVLALCSAGLIVLVGGLAAAGTAWAYPPVPPALSVISATLDGGIVIRYTSLAPGAPVAFTADRISAASFFSLGRAASAETNATADASGTAQGTLAVDQSGVYQVTGTGTAEDGSPAVDTIEVTVPDEGTGSASGSEDLAATGSSDSLTLAGVAVLAILIGAFTVVGARMRRWGKTDV